MPYRGVILLVGHPLELFRAIVPASFAGITAIWFYLEVGILALCTDRLVMFYPYGLLF
jgi:hypothetical protein